MRLATAFCESGPLINIVIKLLNPNDLRRVINERELNKLEKSLRITKFALFIINPTQFIVF